AMGFDSPGRMPTKTVSSVRPEWITAALKGNVGLVFRNCISLISESENVLPSRPATINTQGVAIHHGGLGTGEKRDRRGHFGSCRQTSGGNLAKHERTEIVVFQAPSSHVGLNECWCDRVHGQAILCPLDAQCTDSLNHGPLGCAICRLTGDPN